MSNQPPKSDSPRDGPIPLQPQDAPPAAPQIRHIEEGDIPVEVPDGEVPRGMIHAIGSSSAVEAAHEREKQEAALRRPLNLTGTRVG